MLSSKLLKLGDSYVSILGINGFHFGNTDVTVTYGNSGDFIRLERGDEDYKKIEELVETMKDIGYIIDLNEVISFFKGIKNLKDGQNNNTQDNNDKTLAIQNLRELIAKRMMEQKEKEEKEGN